MPRPKKRVILFILEGPSDRAALERPIQAILQNSGTGIKPTFLVAEKDVTSDSRNNPENILKVINKWYFDPFFSANEFCYPKDIIEVVQVCDLDGTFIPPEYCLMYDITHWDESGCFIYDPPNIFADNPDRIIDRNSRKAENLRFLVKQRTIKVRSKTVPYSIFYFSSNIDHYLHDRLGLSGRDKNDLAAGFADRCMEDISVFYDAIVYSPFAVQGLDYEASWLLVQDGINSLRRRTNFNIYLDALNRRIEEETKIQEGCP